MNALPRPSPRSDYETLTRLQRTNFRAFVRGVFVELHGPQIRFVNNWHIDAFCFRLEEMAAGQLLRCLATMPPRHLKSICGSVAFPAWMLGQNPRMKVILASYGHELADKNVADLRVVLNSPFYRRVFPHIVLASQNAKEVYTTLSGSIKAVSVGGAATGLGADLIVVDDLIKVQEASSQIKRETTRRFYFDTLTTRLNNPATGRILAIQQRTHQDDLAARMLATERFVHLNFPAIAEKDEIIQIGKDRFHHRKKGDLLSPTTHPQTVLDDIKREAGPVTFATQYQQNPVPEGGNRIDWRHWGTLDRSYPIDHYQFRVQSWDTACTDLPDSAYSACTTWGYREGNWHLLDVYRERLNYGPLKQAIISRMRRFRADRVIIENKATGVPLLSEFRRELGLSGTVIGYDPKVDKEIRLEAQVARLEHGNFFLPAEAPWLDMFREECLAAPNGQYCDMVDSFVQFFDWVHGPRGHRSLFGIQRRDPPRR